MASALTAAPLSPEIRLAQAVSEFVADLSDAQKCLFRTQEMESLPPQEKDIIAAVAEIHGVAVSNRASDLLLYGPRMTNFLKAVQEFASLQDDTPDKLPSSQTGSVWLLVRLTFTRLALTPWWLEAVLELFLGLCRSSPFDTEIGFFYSHSERLRSSLYQYYFIVVCICHYLFLLQLRRGYPETISFSTDSTLIRNKSALEKYTIIINEELAILKSQHHPRDPTDSAKAEPGLEKHTDYLQQLGIHINYDYLTTWTKIRKLGSTSLFSFEPSYKRFVECSGSSTLLYSGNAGAGKSVILANMVDNLSQRRLGNAQVIFFFFRWDEVDSPQALVILRAIYHQVLEGLLLTSHASHILKALRGFPTILDDTEDLASYLQAPVEAVGKTYLILDGLDECQESERAKVIEVLQSLQIQCSLSICLSSRPGVLTGLGWTNLHSIDIPTDNRDVSSYIDSEISRLLENRALTVGYPALELQIRSTLTTAAKGNFVWAKRSMELLCAQDTDSDIVRLLEDFRDDSNGINPETVQSILTTSPAPIVPSTFTDSAYASASLIDSNNKSTNEAPAVDESLQSVEHITIDDSTTEYSDVSSTMFSRKQLYIQELAKDLYEKVSSVTVDLGKYCRVDISATLPCLLKAFALRIGYCATTQMHRDVMAFVHRHRSDITAAFLDILLRGKVMMLY